MSQTKFTSGNVTVTLSGELEAFVKAAVKRAETHSLRVARELAEKVAADARAEWYGPRGVTKRTGKSGDIRVVETIDISAGEVKVSVGSTDDRISGRRPVPVYVKRPGRLSLRKVSVTHETYWATAKTLRANYHPVPGRDPEGTSGPYIFELNPKASDGKKLLPLYVKNPVKKAMRAAASDLGKAIARGER